MSVLVPQERCTRVLCDTEEQSAVGPTLTICRALLVPRRVYPFLLTHIPPEQQKSFDAVKAQWQFSLPQLLQRTYLSQYTRPMRRDVGTRSSELVRMCLSI